MDDSSFDEIPEANLKNLMEKETLQWVFVGGKGGVGKTTTSCSIGIQLAKTREKVLIVSTDPAHNLSDAFGQKFTHEPTLVNTFTNLYVMEIDPTIQLEDENDAIGSAEAGGLQSFMKDLTTSIPGIDEAMSFAELMKQVQSMDYSTIVFDTAPTGHTLRLLSFPSTMDKALGKLLGLKEQFGGMFSQFSNMFGGGNSGMPSQDLIMGKVEQTREVIQKVNAQFKDSSRTTFVCVCIPEFLSLYETERLVQELTKFDIEVSNVVVNQVLFPEDKSTCGKCLSRQRMQQKYIDQIYDLYEDFHVVEMPLLDQEVRGTDALRQFSEKLVES